MTNAELTVLRYSSADLAPYRDSEGSLPPGWPNWQIPIEQRWDLDSCIKRGWVFNGWPQPRLTSQGKLALTAAGYPQQMTFADFWEWFRANMGTKEGSSK